MADQQEGAEDRDHGNPLMRPAFIVAAVVVLVIVLLGVIVAVRVARSPDEITTPTNPVPETSAAANPSSTSGDPSASVCGLAGSPNAGPLTAPPAVTWAYQGTTAYPTSPEFGPGNTATEGYRYCFQHSPSGAVVMAANSLTQGSDPKTADTWAQYALGEGPYRDQLARQLGTATGAQDTRIKIAGVRLLNYDDTSARVDLAVKVSSQNQNLTLSAVYELVWQEGDWKVSADVERPLDTATIPDLGGYMPWGE